MATVSGFDTTLLQADVLEILKVGRQTLWKWRRRGWFPSGFPINQRGDLGWHRSEVLAWVEARSTGQLQHLTNSSSLRVQNRVQEVVQSAGNRSQPKKTQRNTTALPSRS